MLPEQKSAPGRLLSLDAYRGFVMLAMASGGAVMIGGPARSDDTVSSHLLQILKQQLDHVPWRGCSFWDLIQPSFMFMVGVAMPFSYWNKNANFAAAFDRWILNRFPHRTDHPFVFNEGGYATLNMNSIAIYLMAQLMKPFVGASLRTHFGHELFSGPYGPLIRGSCTLPVFWLICLWLYRQKIVIKI
jgi:predicted acyltransferase